MLLMSKVDWCISVPGLQVDQKAVLFVPAVMSYLAVKVDWPVCPSAGLQVDDLVPAVEQPDTASAS